MEQRGWRKDKNTSDRMLGDTSQGEREAGKVKVEELPSSEKPSTAA